MSFQVFVGIVALVIASIMVWMGSPRGDRSDVYRRIVRGVIIFMLGPVVKTTR